MQRPDNVKPGAPVSPGPTPAPRNTLDLNAIDPELLASFDPTAQKYLADGNLAKFLVTALPTEGPIHQQVWDILPYFGFDNSIHRRVQDFYMEQADNHEAEPNLLTESRYSYITNAGFGSRFLPSEWIEEFCDDNGRAAEYTKTSQTGKNLFPFAFTLQNLAAHKIEVEKSVYILQHTTGQMVKLFSVAYDFLLTLPYWKLGPLPNRPCVFALYYIGARPLYKRIKGSLEKPIFIGHSTKDASNHLGVLKHKSCSVNANDFALRILLLDSRHYTRCIEGMLVEHYNPVWNNKQIGLKFAKIDKEPENLWIGYHIKQHPKALQVVDTAVASLAMPSEEGDGKCLQQ